MIVVDPNQIAILNVLDNGLGKKAVDFLVSDPGGFVKGDFTGVVVEQRPEDGIYNCQRNLDVVTSTRLDILAKPL